MKSTIIVFIILVVCIALGCSKESGSVPGGTPGNPPEQSPPGNSCDGVNAKFAADILPLIQTKCATSGGCHGNGSFNGPGELNSFTQIKNAANSIKSAVNSGRMPLNSSLSNIQLKQINCWVDNGALNN